MVKKIALEEHFLDPATEPYWHPTMVDVAAPKKAQLLGALNDFGEQRLAMMDKTGIARAVLAIAGPGVQVEPDTAKAVKVARASNDFLAKEVQNRPDRYSGFAHLALQDAKAAADELERCVRELKFRGAMIDGHTNGKYLDDRSYDVFWERAAALDTVIYLHPADPPAPLKSIEGYNVLARPMWGWGVETGSHALRLICGGVFHRYPKAKLVLGHLGEALRSRVGRPVRVVEVTPRTLAEVVERVLDDREWARAQARQGPEYVHSLHDGRRSAAVLAPFLGRPTSAGVSDPGPETAEVTAR